MVTLPNLLSANRERRLCRPVKLVSVVCAKSAAVKGMPVKGVLMSPLVARVRVTVSAATNPPGVRVIPLYLIDAGPSSPDPPWPLELVEVVATVATLVLSASLLTARSLTCEVSVASVAFTSAVVLTASVALVEASVARALAAAASSRASSIWRSRLLSSSFSIWSCSC